MSSDGERATDPISDWHNHCRQAVCKLVMNAVVIDNEPVVDNTASKSSPKTAMAVDDGMGMPNTEEGTPSSEVGKKEDGEDRNPTRDHKINIREVSDAFAEVEIACAFVLPDDNDDETMVIGRSLSAMRSADIVILDWYLRGQDWVLTGKILTEIAKRDTAEKGRMRFICIYSGQPVTDDRILKDAKASLEAGGLKFSDTTNKYSARGDHHVLIVLDKQEVKGKDLPKRLISEMVCLADGLLSSFAMAAVASVRRNMHHIIARFNSKLDAAFVANRLITDPPENVAELMKELFASECDEVISLEDITDDYLGSAQIKTWIQYTDQPKRDMTYKVKEKQIHVNRGFMEDLLREGIIDNNVTTREFGTVKFLEENRVLVSHALHNDETICQTNQCNFARFITFKWEAFGNLKDFHEGWKPYLTLGTLLRIEIPGEEKHKYYYCLTPACDTLRLKEEERAFLFLELKEEKEKFNLVVNEEDGAIRKLFIELRAINMRSFSFKVHDRRVWAKKADGQTFHFESADDTKFTWLGEMRRSRANRDLAELSNNLVRLGIKDSEYLRLAGKGKVKR